MHAMQLVLALGAHFPAIYGWFLEQFSATNGE